MHVYIHILLYTPTRLGYHIEYTYVDRYKHKYMHTYIHSYNSDSDYHHSCRRVHQCGAYFGGRVRQTIAIPAREFGWTAAVVSGWMPSHQKDRRTMYVYLNVCMYVFMYVYVYLNG